MGLILLSHHGLLLLSTVPTILGQLPFQLNSKRAKFSPVLELDRYHLFSPFQFKLWVQCSSNYGCQGFFPWGNFTCFTAAAERYMANSFWPKANQMRTNWIPLWITQQELQTPGPILFIIPASPLEAKWYIVIASCLQGPLANQEHFILILLLPWMFLY